MKLILCLDCPRWIHIMFKIMSLFMSKKAPRAAALYFILYTYTLYYIKKATNHAPLPSATRQRRVLVQWCSSAV